MKSCCRGIILLSTNFLSVVEIVGVKISLALYSCKVSKAIFIFAFK
jgi:hypothetical protein